jgi:hypothetical protein
MPMQLCIKPSCGKQYMSEDEDPYLCPACEKIKKEVAAIIDAKLGKRPKKKTMSALEAYDAAPKFHGFPRA